MFRRAFSSTITTARRSSSHLRRSFSAARGQTASASRASASTMLALGVASVGGATALTVAGRTARAEPREQGLTTSANGAVLATDLPGLTKIYSGKVRDIYAVDDDSFLQVATDRLSSFDVVMTNGIPGKGKILTQLAVWWFKEMEEKLGVQNHLITADVDQMPANIREHSAAIRGRCMLVKKLDMLPVESIVRGYITGSGFKDYKATGEVCGIPLPPDLLDCQRLPMPIFTPSTKAELGLHDENITFDKCVDIIGFQRTQELATQSLKIYVTALALAKSRGIMLADTKFEFGLDRQGNLVLADEILTPDCSRFWDESKYAAGRQQDSLDKQVVRNYLLSINYDKATPMEIPEDVVNITMNKYISIFTTLTGKAPEL